MKKIISIIISITMIISLIPITASVAFAEAYEDGQGVIDLSAGGGIHKYDCEQSEVFLNELPLFVMGQVGDIGMHPEVPESGKPIYFDLDKDGADDFYVVYKWDLGERGEAWFVQCPGTNLTGSYTVNVSDEAFAIIDEDPTFEYYGYFSSVKVIFSKLSVKNCKVSGLGSKVWTGKAIKPTITVKYDGVKLTKGTDYTVSYTNNTKVGTASVKIAGKDKFKGTLTKTFKIIPKGTSISKISPLYKGFKVVWKKQASQTSGYQVRYANNSKFKSSHTKTVSGATKTSRSVTRLSYKKYWVKVRTYKTVNGTKYYSKWSDVKTVSPRQ